jgi:hypothetical protein
MSAGFRYTHIYLMKLRGGGAIVIRFSEHEVTRQVRNLRLLRNHIRADRADILKEDAEDRDLGDKEGFAIDKVTVHEIKRSVSGAFGCDSAGAGRW